MFWGAPQDRWRVWLSILDLWFNCMGARVPGFRTHAMTA